LVKNLKSKRSKNLFKSPKLKMAGKTAFNFLKHFSEESPKMLWRIASFDSSATEIRNSIMLPLAEMILKLKDEKLSADEKQVNNFKFILFWPELLLKLQGFVRKTAFTMGVSAVTSSPRFYKKNRSGEFDKIKKELQNLILIRLWKNLKRSSENESQNFMKRLKLALTSAVDFRDQPELQELVNSVIVDLGLDQLLTALARKSSKKSPSKAKPKKAQVKVK
jgi:hypothetical protein